MSVRDGRGAGVTKIFTLLFISMLAVGSASRVMGQANSTSTPVPEGSQKTVSDKDTVVPTIDTVKVQKATANPMKLSNPENVKTKPVMTPEQKQADKARKKYEKQQRKAAKKSEKAQHKAANQASTAHLNGK
jgi:hypothetical protein